MGFNLTTKCKSCGYVDRMLLGGGFATPRNIDDLVDYSKSKRMKHVLKAIDARFNTSFISTPVYEVYWCHSCNTIHSKLHFIIKYGEHHHYTPSYYCSKCNNILIKIPDETQLVISNHSCKKCGNTSLEESLEQIHWD